MDYTEAKAQLRQLMDVEKRDRKMIPIGTKTYSPNDLMSEMEQETKLGVFLLEDFIAIANGTPKVPSLTAFERADAMALMEHDLEIAPPGWADTVIMTNEGKDWTPNQLMQEVRNETELGKAYVVSYYDNYCYHLALGTFTEEEYRANSFDMSGDLPMPEWFSLSPKKSYDQAN